MKSYSLSHLADPVLLRDLAALVARDHVTTAELLAHLAEVEARRLYVPAGYPSLRSYCVGVLHMSEDEAGRRIHVANKGRLYPVLLDAIAEGRLHLTGASLLASHLTPQNVDELLAAAANRTKSEIEYLIACRFPRPDVATSVRALAPQPAGHVPEHVGRLEAAPSAEPVNGHVPEHAGALALTTAAAGPATRHAPEHAPTRAAKLAPLSAQSYELRTTLDQETHDLLRSAQELEGLSSSPGSVAEILKRALKARVAWLEKRKFAATGRPRTTPPRASRNPRHIPAAVKRAVRKRDGGQCTFVSDSGHRCESRRVQFDHIEDVARGGQATVPNIRLRCHAHNQYAAERRFGVGFMQRKREEAKQVTAERAARRARAAEEGEATPHSTGSTTLPSSSGCP